MLIIKKNFTYSYRLSESKEKWSYSGWIKMSAYYNKSDLWSTYFRYLSIAFIERKYFKSKKWIFRKLPSLGWFYYNN